MKKILVGVVLGVAASLAVKKVRALAAPRYLLLVNGRECASARASRADACPAAAPVMLTLTDGGGVTWSAP